MKIKINDEISLKKISDSGQCFRFKELGDNSFLIISRDKYVIAKQDNDLSEIYLDCSKTDYNNLWSKYFDLDTNYKKIRGLVDKNDNFLKKASIYGQGIRILNQDKFEALISFIISQRKSIPAIKTSIEKLCKTSGKIIGEYQGEKIYSFPSPIDIFNTSVEKLNTCSLGYRLPYILKAVEEIVENPDILYDMDSLNDDELLDRLKSFYGVGSKIASCVMLFSFHRLDTFPIDVWIKRAILNEYDGEFPFHKYRKYNGVMQQYIFMYYRNNKINDKKI